MHLVEELLPQKASTQWKTTQQDWRIMGDVVETVAMTHPAISRP